MRVTEAFVGKEKVRFGGGTVLLLVVFHERNRRRWERCQAPVSNTFGAAPHHKPRCS